MLSPDRSSPKRAAPSIHSLDSGYRSGSLYTTSLEELALAQPFALHPNHSHEHLPSPIEEEKDGLLDGAWNAHGGEQSLYAGETLIDPLATKLTVSTKNINHGYYLPELPSGKEACLICEFLRSTNPEGDVKCDECRIPQTVEPNLLVFTLASTSQAPAHFPFHREPHRTRCTACELSTLIDPSSPLSCHCCSPTSAHLSPIVSPSSGFKVRRSRAGRNSKLPLAALTQLQAWLDAHQDNPYPSAEEKRQLARDCGISEKQINTWFTNARARQLSPLETWLSSGSEDDGAHESDIASAAGTPVYTNGFSFLSEAHAMSGRRRAGSVSGSSALSTANPRSQVSRRGKKKNYRRTNQPPQITEHSPITSPVSPTTGAGNNAPTDQEMWQCTFCTRQLVPKSWRRHEETQHRPKAEWTCMLDGPRLIRTNALSECAFCMEKNPCEDHFAQHHRISECAKRPVGERTFYRPDHLRQHVKNFHGATLYDVVQNRWKRRAADAGDRGFTCGFCGVWLENWDRRETHIAGHFKEGSTMADWTDPAVWNARKKSKQSVGMNMDMVPEKKEKKLKEKEEKHTLGLSRLSRSFTRRSARKFEGPEQAQPQRPPIFANPFMPIPTSMPASTPISYPINHAYSAPPQLPDINIDPLMTCDDSYGTLVDWSQIHTTSGDMDMGLSMSMAPETQFGNATYDPEFERMMAMAAFGNPVDQHGLGNGNVNVNGWGPN